MAPRTASTPVRSAPGAAIAACLALALALVLASPASAADPAVIQDIGGSAFPAVTAVNNNGVMVGEARIGATPQAFSHDTTDGTTTQLGSLGTGTGASVAVGINDHGTLGGPSARAFAVNDHGIIVGKSDIGTGVWHAFSYDLATGHMTDLGSLDGAGMSSEAHSINNHGVIVGNSDTAAGHAHAFLYDPAVGHMTDLGTLPGQPLSGALDINDNGLVVGIAGQSIHDPAMHAFVYDADTGVLSELETIAGATGVIPASINDHNLVVGELRIGDVGYAFSLQLPGPEVPTTTQPPTTEPPATTVPARTGPSLQAPPAAPVDATPTYTG